MRNHCSPFFGLLLVLGLVHFPPIFLKAEAQDSKRETIVVAHWGQEKILLYLPFYVAMEEGYFAAQGIDVKLRFSGNDDQVFASVMSGDAQFGIGDPAFAAIARERGFPGKVIALLVKRIGLSGYTRKNDVPVIEREDQLGGLRIGSFPAPSTTYTLLKEIVDRAPTSLPPPVIVQLGIGAQAAALAGNSVDIASDLEPAVSVAETNGYRVVFSLDRFTKELAITGLSTTESVIRERPLATQGMVKGINRALHVLQSDPEIGVRVAMKCFPKLPENVVRRAVQRMTELQVYPENAKIPADLWDRTLEMRRASRELKNVEKGREAVEGKFAEASEAGAGAQ